MMYYSKAYFLNGAMSLTFVLLQDVFKNLDTEVDEEFELDLMVNSVKQKGGVMIGQKPNEDEPMDSTESDSEYEVEKEVYKANKNQKSKENQDGFETVPAPKGNFGFFVS